jgi:hypothetical protein
MKAGEWIGMSLRYWAVVRHTSLSIAQGEEEAKDTLVQTLIIRVRKPGKERGKFEQLLVNEICNHALLP